MPDAFISYSRSDAKDFVARLAEALQGAGKDVWVDLEDIAPASRWREALEDGVLGSDVFVYVISPGAVASEHCRGELEGAVARNKRIVPVAHLEVPDDGVPEAVAGLNWVPQTDTFSDDFDRSLRTLIEAIETDAELVREHTRWQERAEGWQKEGRDRSLLARGSELAEAEAWLTAQAGREPAATALQAEWLAAGRQGARRRQGIAFGAIAVALLVAAALAIVAIAQRNDAREQRDAARAGELASDAVANLEVDPELSLILALEAERTDRSPRTEQTLQRALLASRIRERFAAQPGVGMNAVALSEDGRLIATGDADGRATVWSAKTGEEITHFDRGAEVGGLDFTPDGRRLVVGMGSGIHVFDLGAHREVDAFSVFKTAIDALDVSPDGKLVAAGSLGGGAGVVGMDRSHPVQLGDYDKRVSSVTFTPDGSGVLTASAEEEAVLWDATDGSRRLVLSGNGGPSSDAEMSPDGRYIATANHDGSAVLWDARTGAPVGDPLVPVNKTAVVLRVAFVPGERTVVTAGGGGEVDAWDIDTGERIGSYRGHTGLVAGLAASPDGQLIATAAFDGTARIWDLGQRLYTTDGDAPVGTLEFSSQGDELVFSDGQAVIVHADTGAPVGRADAGYPVHGAAFGPAGKTLATANGDGLGRVYDLESGDRLGPAVRQGTAGNFTNVEFSGDGARLMTASFRNGASVWSWPAGELVRRVGADGKTFDAALSPDGARVAIVSGEPEVSVYDVETGRPALELRGHADQVSTVDYDLAGGRLVTAGEDGTARVWDSGTGEQLLLLGNDGQPVRAAGFSGDGRVVVTTSAAGELRVWNAATGLELMRVDGPDWAVAASPTGALLAGAVLGSRASVYECDVCELGADDLEALAEERITRELTEDERTRYLGSG